MSCFTFDLAFQFNNQTHSTSGPPFLRGLGGSGPEGRPIVFISVNAIGIMRSSFFIIISHDRINYGDLPKKSYLSLKVEIA